MIYFFINLLVIIVLALLSILNQFFSVEYLVNQNIENTYLAFLLKGSVIIFYLISLIYILLMVMTFSTFDEREISEVDNTEYEYQIVTYLIKKLGYFSLILSVFIYFILSALKLMSLIHIKRISLEKGLHFAYFKSHITYYSTILQIVLLTIPQIFLQIWNNLNIEEDIHDPHARGILNISTLTGVGFILLNFIFVLVALGNETNKNDKKYTNKHIETVM